MPKNRQPEQSTTMALPSPSQVSPTGALLGHTFTEFRSGKVASLRIAAPGTVRPLRCEG